MNLTIVGTGIKMAAHITVEAEAHIRQAEQVFYLANHPVTAQWITQLNPQSVDLATCHAAGKERLRAYKEMAARILEAVRQGKRVCAVFYGHPGVFVLPAHLALRQARQEGFAAQMLPGISAEDCLFADLGIDPAREGCQSYEATDFLARPRRFDACTPLVLWQIGVIGNLYRPSEQPGRPGLELLVETLQEHYGSDHQVFVYQAGTLPGADAWVQPVPLAHLPDATVTPDSTLYVPPRALPALSDTLLERLGLSSQQTTIHPPSSG